MQVLKHLTIKRPLEAVRTDFFAQVGIRHPGPGYAVDQSAVYAP